MRSAVLGEIRYQAAQIMSQADIEQPRHEADLLLSAVLDLTLAFITGHPYHILSALEVNKVEEALRCRATRIPLAYITGRAVFFDLDFLLDRGVLIPRPDSEVLVEAAIHWLEKRLEEKKAELSVLDLCAGCGCIGISIAVHMRRKGQKTKLKMTEIDQKALDYIQKNIVHHSLEKIACFEQTDLFPGDMEKYDLIVANPPYIPSADIDGLMPEVKCFEPRQALDGGEDGLVFYRRIIDLAPLWLNPGGVILLEHGYDQEESLGELLNENGKYIVFPTIIDYGGNPRVSGGCLLQKMNHIGD